MSKRWGLPFVELDGLRAEPPGSFWGKPMSSDLPAKSAHRDGVAGVPPADVCEARAEQARRVAEETKLDNVRDLYTRSALRWAELAELKITER